MRFPQKPQLKEIISVHSLYKRFSSPKRNKKFEDSTVRRKIHQDPLMAMLNQDRIREASTLNQKRRSHIERKRRQPLELQRMFDDETLRESYSLRDENYRWSVTKKFSETEPRACDSINWLTYRQTAAAVPSQEELTNHPFKLVGPIKSWRVLKKVAHTLKSENDQHSTSSLQENSSQLRLRRTKAFVQTDMMKTFTESGNIKQYKPGELNPPVDHMKLILERQQWMDDFREAISIKKSPQTTSNQLAQRQIFKYNERPQKNIQKAVVQKLARSPSQDVDKPKLFYGEINPHKMSKNTQFEAKGFDNETPYHETEDYFHYYVQTQKL